VTALTTIGKQSVIPTGFTTLYTVCGFCRSVCAPSRADRLANRTLISNSGTTALKLDGPHVVADDKSVKKRTPFGLNVVVPSGELSKEQKKNQIRSGQFPLDEAVIDYLRRQLNLKDTQK
jgi:hypothetical protein